MIVTVQIISIIIIISLRLKCKKNIDASDNYHEPGKEWTDVELHQKLLLWRSF